VLLLGGSFNISTQDKLAEAGSVKDAFSNDKLLGIIDNACSYNKTY